jgi:hypothetical protein
VHIADCDACLELVRGLRADVGEIDDESRLVLVPAHVLESAMGLREGDDKSGRVAEIVVRARDGRLWMTSARRGLAAAAALAIVVGGYHIGRSLTPQPAVVAADNSDSLGLTFGLLDATLLPDSDGDDRDDYGLGLFAIAMKEGQS